MSNNGHPLWRAIAGARKRKNFRSNRKAQRVSPFSTLQPGNDYYRRVVSQKGKRSPY
jgi:hypothetical protein